MSSVLWLIPVALAIILIIFLPLKLEVSDLPGLFSDEPEGVVETRPDLAVLRGADESYQLRTMRTFVTYSTQLNGDVHTELFEITYRGRPGPALEIDNGRPVRFGFPGSKDPKVFFVPRDLRDIEVFAHHVRTCVTRYRTST